MESNHAMERTAAAVHSTFEMISTFRFRRTASAPFELTFMSLLESLLHSRRPTRAPVRRSASWSR